MFSDKMKARFAGLVLAGAALAAPGMAAVLAAFLLGLAADYQIDRLTAIASPDEGARTFGYITQQARIAIGAGGLLGRGLGQGSQTGASAGPEAPVVYAPAEVWRYRFAGLVVPAILLAWIGYGFVSSSAAVFGWMIHLMFLITCQK